MELKTMTIVSLLLVILSLQFSLSLGEEVNARVPQRKARQSNYCYDNYYSYYSYYNSYYNKYYYCNPDTNPTIGAWALLPILSLCVICCLPCIITGIVLCCCFLIPGCPLASRNSSSSQTVTSTTVTGPTTESAPPAYLQADYPQTGYPQTGYPQPVQASNLYPPTQGYYPDTAPAQVQAYPSQQAEPVKYPDGYQPTPGNQPYPTDQAPPIYTETQNEPQTQDI